MKNLAFPPASPGPFLADQIRPGDPYELSNGHTVHCVPQGGRGAGASLVGAAVLGSDPAVESAGVEAGFAPSPNTLRAPDVSVGNVPPEPGWIQGVPPLAVEYADTGQDEADLKVKIAELLAAGTQLVWVVRLVGPRRVEVHKLGEPVWRAHPGEELTAPGILANPVPVEALYDARAGRRATLRNLLQREGFESLDAVRAEGAAEGKAEGLAEGKIEGIAEGEARALRDAIHEALSARGIDVGEAVASALAQCADSQTLRLWHRRAVTAATAEEIFLSP